MLFRFILIVFLLVVVGCDRASLDTESRISSDENSNDKSGVENCTISQEESDDFLAVINCPDGTSLKIPKSKDGLNGSSCTVQAAQGGALVSCDDGSQAFIKNGKDGVDGSSCSVQSINAVASLIECSDGSSSLIDLESMLTHSAVKTIDPCGDLKDEYDEVLLVFNDGSYLAYFENDDYRFLTLLGPGKYRTTDKQKCEFKIDEDGNYQD